MPYIEIRVEYDSWLKERGIDTQPFVDKMLGELIKDEQEREKKEAQKAKEKTEQKSKEAVIPDVIPAEAVEKKPPSRKKKGKKVE